MLKKVLFNIIFLFLMSFVLVSCKSSGTKDSYIKIEVHEQQTNHGTVIQIPEFISNNEEIRKNLRSLDKEIKELEKIVEKEQKKDSIIEMRSYVGGSENYPQVTVVWYIDEEESRFYNILTFRFVICFYHCKIIFV